MSAAVQVQLKERPILFSGAMVRAILEGRKTQTRRVAKALLGNNPKLEYRVREADGEVEKREGKGAWYILARRTVCPYGKPGDQLWVRETLRRDPDANVWYYAAGKPEDWVTVSPDDHTASLVWASHKEGDVCPSIHMPRWASRINLEITKVRVERVQEITHGDAKAEGAECLNHFSKRWDSIYFKRGYGWDKNPWVWVVEFSRIQREAAHAGD